MNLRGTLEVVQLAMRARDQHGLRRFSHVSTVAVAGQRANEVVEEDTAIDWSRSDYDPYARTKKFCEHMVRQLLPDVRRTIFRPSIVLGDSRRAETNQFDMVRAFVFLAGLPALPFRPADRIDIVPGRFCRGCGGDIASERKSRARDLPSLVRHGFRDVRAIDGRAFESAGAARPGLRAQPGEALVENGERAGGPGWQDRRARQAAEGVLAVPCVEHGLRQHAGCVSRWDAARRRFRNIATLCCALRARTISHINIATGRPRARRKFTSELTQPQARRRIHADDGLRPRGLGKRPDRTQ